MSANESVSVAMVGTNVRLCFESLAQGMHPIVLTPYEAESLARLLNSAAKDAAALGMAEEYDKEKDAKKDGGS